jgi:hypothetical protein
MRGYKKRHESGGARRIGTKNARLLISIAEVIPNCTPEGDNGHVKARLYAHTTFENNDIEDFLLRDFS